MKRNSDIKIIKASNIKNINIKNKEDYVGMITMKEKDNIFGIMMAALKKINL